MNQGFAESRIPVATGEGHEFSNVYPLYSVAAITFAAFMGAPIGASWLMAINYRRTGQPDKASTSLLAGLGATILAFVIGYLVPQTMALPLGIGVLFGTRGVAQSLQGPLLDKHLREGGAFESNWKVFGIGLVFLVVYCAAIFGVGYGVDYVAAINSRITLGAQCQVYYKDGASRQDAEALGKALQQIGFETDRPSGVRLSKKDGKTAVAFVVKEGFWDKAGTADSFEEIGREIAPSIGGFPLTVRLVNSHWETKKEMTVGKVSTASHLELYYYGTATESEANSLAKALEAEGMGADHRVSVFLTKGGDETAITFIVRDGLWDDPAQVANYQEFLRKIAPSVGGLPVTLRLANSATEVKTESRVR